MKTWEVDVELRVRKTLVIRAPSAAFARSCAAALLGAGLKIEPGHAGFLKWTKVRGTERPTPVETFIDDNPRVVAVREVPDV
jgi:hypothetical protein